MEDSPEISRKISALRYQIIFKVDQRLQNLSVLLVIKIDS